MTKQPKLIAAEADEGHEVKGSTKPARVAKAANVRPKTSQAVDLATGAGPTVTVGLTKVTVASPTMPPRQTKAALLRARLAEPGGVSLAVLMEATRWQAHTLRAALSGLRKTGMAVTRRREGNDTIYGILARVPLTAGSLTTELAGEAAADRADPAFAAPADGATEGQGAHSAMLTTDGAPA